MVVDQAWMKRNLGFDPAIHPLPGSTFAFAPAAKKARTPEDLQRELIEFDSEAPSGREFLAFSTSTGLSRFTDIAWPAGLGPRTSSKPGKGGNAPLPKADVLVVAWTVDEGHAVSRVLTPGKDSRNDYLPYTHNFAAISKKMRAGCPALQLKRLGAFWTTTIGKKKVVVFKSDSHLSQDVKKLPAGNGTLPNYDVWTQIIAEVQPELVITTGTAGGIGPACEVGDVVVSPIVRFDGIKWMKSAPYHLNVYTDPVAPDQKYFADAQGLFKFNSDQLPKENTRPPKIVVSTLPAQSVLTTDFFGFDTSDNHFQLQGLGAVSEMGDAVLGQVASQMQSPPQWFAVRNVSDPQIKAEGTLNDQANRAAAIYKGYGRWSTVCSSIVCWSLIAAL
jgi:nucleoside phosphorylase